MAQKKKSEYIYSRSREVRKENPHSIIDTLTLKKIQCFMIELGSTETSVNMAFLILLRN